MPDPRISKLAQVLVNYSLELQPGEELFLNTSPQAEALSLAVYKEAILAGAHVLVNNGLPGAQELFFNHASDAQLDHVSPAMWFIFEKFDANLQIGAAHNTRELSSVDPARQGRVRKAQAKLFQMAIERISRRDLKWCYTV